jgi:hypothetical protein
VPALSDAIEGLYRAFGAVPRPRRIDGCPCCIDRKGIAVLLSKPLRAISPSELASYASSALLTVGDVTDYVYFLPRVLEITATEPGWWPSAEVTGRAIRRVGPRTWPSARRSALDAFLAAVVDEAIPIGQHDRLDEWLCAVAQMGLDVGPHLERIARCPAAVLAYFEANAESLPRGELSNSFWERPCPGHDAVVDWFFSPDVARVPFEAYGCVLARPG